jgi:nicotinamide mononucleotide transporter
VSTIELVATAFGLACVWLYVRQSIWSWPAGLVQVVLFAWVFYQARLYSDFLLHLVYIVLQIYGWHHWAARGAPLPHLPIARLTPQRCAMWGAIALLGSLALGGTMHRFADASLPYWDASIAAMSLVAQYLLARKILENWLLWIAVDIVAIGVYLAKGLYVTSGLYAVFLCMATAGWMAWLTSYRRQTTVGVPHPGTSEAAAGSPSANSCPRTAGISS